MTSIVPLVLEVEDQYGSVIYAPNDDPRFLKIRKILNSNRKTTVGVKIDPEQRKIIVEHLQNANKKLTIDETYNEMLNDPRLEREYSTQTLRKLMRKNGWQFIKKTQGHSQFISDELHIIDRLIPQLRHKGMKYSEVANYINSHYELSKPVTAVYLADRCRRKGLY
ncbi:hypothetical protein [Lactobacillus acetotolerans]|uniref:hypothetical protein n=1 Tax=Lactobacillus acetotolerans TaxID=1600 RepID=UPI002FDB19AE